MAIKDYEGGTTYGPSWVDCVAASLELQGSTGWKVYWDAHLEHVGGRPRAYWKVHAVRPSHLGAEAPPVITRGDFFPSPRSATVPGLLHRLLAEVDSDLARVLKRDALSELPLFRGA